MVGMEIGRGGEILARKRRSRRKKRRSRRKRRR